MVFNCLYCSTDCRRKARWEVKAGKKPEDNAEKLIFNFLTIYRQNPDGYFFYNLSVLTPEGVRNECHKKYFCPPRCGHFFALCTNDRRKKTRMSGFLSSCFITETVRKQN